MKLKFDNICISVPQKWSEITLGDYEQWHNDTPESNSDYMRMMATICKTDINTLMNAPAGIFDELSKVLNFINNTQVEATRQIDIDGETYSIATTDKLTLGEWVDIDSILNSNSTTKISEMLAVVCRPLGETYNADTINGRKELFRSLGCDKALALISFFLRKKKKSEEISNLYSEVVAQANQFVQDTEHFVTNGDGIKQLPIWQRIKYTYLMKYLKKQLSKFSEFYYTGSTSQGLKTNKCDSNNK